MIRLSLNREGSTEQGTTGILYHDGRLICRTIELPWNANERGESCIPPGVYRVDYMARSASGKYRDVYHVQDVPGRSAILIHPANFAGDVRKGWRSDLLGCIAPCERIGELKNHRGVMQLAGIGSRLALHKIHAVTGRQSFWLEIV